MKLPPTKLLNDSWTSFVDQADAEGGPEDKIACENVFYMYPYICLAAHRDKEKFKPDHPELVKTKDYPVTLKDQVKMQDLGEHVYRTGIFNQ